MDKEVGTVIGTAPTVDIMQSGIQHGFRQMWIEGSDDSGLEFTLTAGAGLGSPWLILTVKKDGDDSSEAIDVRDLLKAWVPEAEARLTAQKDAP